MLPLTCQQPRDSSRSMRAIHQKDRPAMTTRQQPATSSAVHWAATQFRASAGRACRHGWEFAQTRWNRLAHLLPVPHASRFKRYDS